MKRTTSIFILAFLFFGGSRALADGARLTITGSGSYWWVMEEVENGLQQAGSGDQAAQEASGFNFKQGRVGFHFLSPEGRVEALLKFRLEERTDIIDAWGAYHAAPWFGFYIGLMKIPATAEVLQPDTDLDFIVRSNFARYLGDYTLSRTPYISLLMASTSNNRDMGMAFKGDIPDKSRSIVRYFVMISNGIGGNQYVGGSESSEYFYANNFGDYCYSARMEVEPVPGMVFGGHYSFNRHDDLVFRDKKTVIDLEREAWSADFGLKAPWGTRIYGFYGQGRINDFWTQLDYGYNYSEYGLQVIQGFLDDRIEVGVRFDSFTYEFNDDDNDTEQRNWTIGVNLAPAPEFRVQINYMDKDTVNDFIDDAKDNVFLVNFQFNFAAGLEVPPLFQ